MKRQPLILLFIALSIVWMIPSGASAQLITAPFDPTKPVQLPAAAGWRENRAAGITYREASGNRKIESVERYKFDIAGLTANTYFKIGNLSTDIAWAQRSTKTKAELLDDGRLNLDNDTARFNIALSGNDFVTVGLGARNFRSHDFFDVSHDSEVTTETGIAGSMSVKIMDFLFLGGGYERIKEESTFTVENSWNTLTMGAAAIIGQPGETRLRLEYSYSSSPQSKSEALGKEEAAVHHETETSRYSAELMLSGLLFSARGTEQKRTLSDPFYLNQNQYNEISNSKNEAGVLWVPESGVVLGFYFAASRTSFFFEDEQTEFRVNLAYVFE